jgi:parvulin-like peptidyl-prolyl isomerase
MKLSRIGFVLVVPVLAVVLAGCGGGKSTAKLTSADVAVVGDSAITKKQFDDLMATAVASYKQQGKTFPKQGTTDYASIKTQAINILVQNAEREQKLVDLGGQVTDKQVTARLNQIKQQYFNGSESSYKQQLKTQGLSEAEVREQVRAQLVSEALYKKITDGVKVTDAEVHTYYVNHTSEFKQPASRTVRHILVKKKTLAQSIYSQLKGGANFAKLAKKYSIDTASAAQGGKYDAVKGQSVAAFDKVAFQLKVNEISPPVHTQYGWHVIQALTAIKPATTKTEKQAASSIKSQLLTNKQQQAVTDWSNQLTKDYCEDSQIKYQAGFTPSPDPCTTATTSTSTTTTG